MLLGNTLNSCRLTPTGLLPSTAQRSRKLRLQRQFLTVRARGNRLRVVPQPHTRNACRLSHAHGLASSAFARHYSRNHNCFLFLRVLRCFTSPRSLQNPMCSGTGNWPLNASWVSPFGHPRITAWLPTPRGLSQAPTSFIGSWYQDIHRLPLVACHTTKNTTKEFDARVHYTVLNIRPGQPTQTHHLATPARTRKPPVWCGPALQETNPKPPEGTQRPDSSGPNSAPRHLDQPPPRSTPTGQY